MFSIYTQYIYVLIKYISKWKVKINWTNTKTYSILFLIIKGYHEPPKPYNTKTIHGRPRVPPQPKFWWRHCRPGCLTLPVCGLTSSHACVDTRSENVQLSWRRNKRSAMDLKWWTRFVLTLGAIFWQIDNERDTVRLAGRHSVFLWFL